MFFIVTNHVIFLFEMYELQKIDNDLTKCGCQYDVDARFVAVKPLKLIIEKQRPNYKAVFVLFEVAPEFALLW